MKAWRKKSAFPIALAYFGFLGAGPPTARAGDNPVSFGLTPFFYSYTSSGDLHELTRVTSTGVLARVQYPLSDHFRLEVSAAYGVSGKYEFFGGGVDYEFFSPAMAHEQQNEQIEIEHYQKWRPFVSAQVGFSNVNTMVDLGRLQEPLVENLFGLMLSGGVRYALGPKWTLDGSLLIGIGSTTNVSSTGFGLAVGASFYTY